jgi:hypothetical protein
MRIFTLLQHWRKEAAIILAMLVTLIGPFLLKTSTDTVSNDHRRRLVIVTPHHEQIREEFADAFAQHWKQATGESITIDWRVPGGTAEIAMMLKSEFIAAFEQHWTQKMRQTWNSAVASACLDPKAPANDVARSAFLNSEVGIGMDLFFGGGGFDFQMQADAGTLVASVGKETGLRSIREKQPNWFSDAVIPLKMSGEVFRDERDRWCGTCLSSFGIVFNRDVLRRLGIG